MATEGTAQALHSEGLEVTLTHKLAEHGKNVIDLMKENGLPIVTTESGARATIAAVRYIGDNSWDVQAIQEYHA